MLDNTEVLDVSVCMFMGCHGHFYACGRGWKAYMMVSSNNAATRLLRHNTPHNEAALMHDALQIWPSQPSTRAWLC